MNLSNVHLPSIPKYFSDRCDSDDKTVIKDEAFYQGLLDQCMMLIIGAPSTVGVETFFNELRDQGLLKFGTCDVTWNYGDTAYKCKTCQLDPTTAMCIGCFNAGDHKGHDYALQSVGGGFCDCGDPTAFKTSGFCSKHKELSEIIDITKYPERFILALCYVIQFILDRTYKFFEENREKENELFMDWLLKLSQRGDIVKIIVIKYIANTDIGQITALLPPSPFNPPLLQQFLDPTKHNTVSSELKQSFVNFYFFKRYFIHRAPWMKRSYKVIKAKDEIDPPHFSYIIHFPSIPKSQISRLRTDIGFILSNHAIARSVVQNDALVALWFRMISLVQGMNPNLQNRPTSVQEWVPSFTFDLSFCNTLFSLVDAVDRNRTSIERFLFQASHTLGQWILGWIAVHQQKLEQKGTINQVIQESSKTDGFTYHLILHRAIAAILYVGISECGQELTAAGKLTGTFSRIVGENSPISIIDYAKCTLYHPLKLFASLGEIRAGLWRSHGREEDMFLQTSMYQSLYYQRFYDLDILMVQIGSVLLGPNLFMEQALTEYNLQDWFKFESPLSASGKDVPVTPAKSLRQSQGGVKTVTATPSKPPKDETIDDNNNNNNNNNNNSKEMKEKENKEKKEKKEKKKQADEFNKRKILAEDFIQFLIMVSTNKTMSGMTTQEIIRKELVHRLCLGDATHSQLTRTIKRTLATHPDFDKILNDIAIFQNPQKTEQGKYQLKEACWAEFDPYFAHYNTQDLQSAEERLTDFNNKTKSNIARGTYITYKTLPCMEDLDTLLCSKTVHQILLTILQNHLVSSQRTTETLFSHALHALELCIMQTQTMMSRTNEAAAGSTSTTSTSSTTKKMSTPQKAPPKSTPALATDIDFPSPNNIFTNATHEVNMETKKLSMIIVLVKLSSQQGLNAEHKQQIQNILNILMENDNNCKQVVENYWQAIRAKKAISTPGKREDPEEEKKRMAKARQAAILAQMKTQQAAFKFDDDDDYEDEDDQGAQGSSSQKDKKTSEKVDPNLLIVDGQVQTHTCALCREAGSLKRPMGRVAFIQRSSILMLSKLTPEERNKRMTDAIQRELAKSNKGGDKENNGPEEHIANQNNIHNALNDLLGQNEMDEDDLEDVEMRSDDEDDSDDEVSGAISYLNKISNFGDYGDNMFDDMDDESEMEMDDEYYDQEGDEEEDDDETDDDDDDDDEEGDDHHDDMGMDDGLHGIHSKGGMDYDDGYFSSMDDDDYSDDDDEVIYDFTNDEEMDRPIQTSTSTTSTSGINLVDTVLNLNTHPAPAAPGGANPNPINEDFLRLVQDVRQHLVNQGVVDNGRGERSIGVRITPDGRISFAEHGHGHAHGHGHTHGHSGGGGGGGDDGGDDHGGDGDDDDEELVDVNDLFDDPENFYGDNDDMDDLVTQYEEQMDAVRGNPWSDKFSTQELFRNTEESVNLHMSFCGHQIHEDCFTEYSWSQLKNQNYESEELVDPQRGEFQCVLCRRLGNALVPVIPDSGFSAPADSATPVPAPQNTDDAYRTFLTQLQSQLTTEQSSKTLDSLKPVRQAIDQFASRIYSVEHQISFIHSESNEKVLPFIASSIASTIADTELAIRVSEDDNTSFSLSIAKPRQLPLFGMSESNRVDIRSLFRASVAHVKTHTPQQWEGCVLWNSISGQTAMAMPVLEEIADEDAEKIKTREEQQKKMDQEHFPPLLSLDLYHTFIQTYLRTSAQDHTVVTANERFYLMTKMFFDALVTQSIFSHFKSFDDNAKSEMFISEVNKLITTPNDNQQTISTMPKHLVDMIRSHCLIYLRKCSLFLYACLNVDPTQLALNQPEINDEIETELLMAYLCLPGPFETHLIKVINTLITHSSTLVPLVSLWADQMLSSYAIYLSSVEPSASEGTSTPLSIISSPTIPKPFLLIDLAKNYDTLSQHYATVPCQQCKTISSTQALCLICGTLCCLGGCCKRFLDQKNECILHAERCNAGTCMFLVIKSSSILLLHLPRRTYWFSPYLDDHGEEDANLRRGKPLFLNAGRYNQLNSLLIKHQIDQDSKIAEHTIRE
ncbi:hypothetical protein SAMD00019534_035950 [Acytostelium subglobosum LB1]|uniref:hypothetical protein n=1 Tax=Acytostelium subglobosum LB1 TaxID=1410327 RepID=UPI000644E9C6|nr:hypothetical protein SAMD00019534_035950 [Acytostelium subglobosum LB1]GAM20420.1 hypothetical protein SAMD00019534_035950 [Acytostelium subglobosum LB1]|eukprot:XP_012759941.1 hypothetical protein SAMD00019534_035950 [Acytostelium subglobosum LB1]